MSCRQFRQRVIITTILLLFVIPFINSQKIPSITSEPYYKQGVETTIPLPCTIGGDYCSLNATCKTTIINPENQILFNNYDMIRNDAVFEVTLLANQTEIIGEYQFNVVCSDNGQSISRFLKFYISPNGENPSVAKGLIYIGLLIVLFILFIFMVIGGIKADFISLKTGLFLFAYLVFIGITFISWNLSNDYLTSAPFITETFRIMFYFTLIAFFPTVLISLIYVIYMLVTIKAIQRMIDRGIPEDEAYERQVRGGMKNIFKK